jgi:hypothetical protein
MAELGLRTCTVGAVGPASDANETSAPVIYVQLTDEANAWPVKQWFDADDVAKREILAIALMARSLNRPVSAEVDAPNPPGPGQKYTAIHRTYLS